MYISCFVGHCCTSTLSCHQTFILQKRIYISRDPAQLNLAGASTSPSSSCYRSLRMFHVLARLFSSLPLPHPPHTHTHSFTLFCSNPLLLKASLSFFLWPLLILSFIVIKLWEKQRTAHAVLLDMQKPCGQICLIYVKVQMNEWMQLQWSPFFAVSVKLSRSAALTLLLMEHSFGSSRPQSQAQRLIWSQFNRPRMYVLFLWVKVVTKVAVNSLS